MIPAALVQLYMADSFVPSQQASNRAYPTCHIDHHILYLCVRANSSAVIPAALVQLWQPVL